MAEVTTNGQKMVDCRIEYGDDWIEITNIGSKTSKKLDVTKIDNNWAAFEPEDQRLFDKLMSKMSPHTMTLSGKEMVHFLACIKRTEEVPTGTPYVPAKGDVEVVGIEPLRQESAPPTITNPIVPVAALVNGVPTATVTMSIPSQPKFTPQKPRTPDRTHNERVQAAVEATANCGYVMFIYDIPQRLNALNPSGRMWRHGFRANLSCWIMPAGQVSRIQDVLQTFTANDISWHIVEYAESARAKIKSMAQEEIRKETARIHKSLLDTMEAATKQFDDARKASEEAIGNPQRASDLLSGRDLEKKASYRESRIRAALKSAGENLNKAIESAILFDEQESLDDLFISLRQTIASKNEAFYAECAARARF